MSNLSRRNALAEVKVDAGTHAGLWLDRYLRRQTGIEDASERDETDAKTAKTNLITEVARTIKTASGYRQAFDTRFETIAGNPHERTIIGAFRCVGRMVVGLGQKGVIENGITLERAWGVPVLPGPALKGVAASTAHHLVDDPSWRKGTKDSELGASAAYLFGTTERAGRVTFHDAWWIADADRASLPVYADVITVHNSHYYRDKETPDGMSSPIPVSFLSASGTYLVMLSSRQEDASWADAAMELVTLGLRHLGIGAKTNAGYGRFEPDAGTTEHWRGRLDKMARSAALSQQPLDGILGQAIAHAFERKNGLKTFTDQLNKVIKGNHCDLADLFYYDVFSEALGAYGGSTHTSDAQTLDALRAAMRANPIVQGWLYGEHDSEVAFSRSSGWMQKAAQWAGLEEDRAAPVASDDPLIGRFPNAQNLPEEARAAFRAVFGEDGSVDAEKLMELDDEVVEAWGDEALRVYFALLDEVG